MSGKVYLVGAGPSDVGLLTLKAKWAIEHADVVVYDALVGEAILALVPPAVRCVNVGKRAGYHTKPQKEIHQILLEEARKGNTVVRLKGGDPFLFGRGGEELELLAANGVACEVVPGVTSAIAVPACCGIPVTHRDYSSSVHIVTAHKQDGTAPDLDYRALVRLNGTIVFLMGVGVLPDICRGLLQAGMDPDMPAAILHRGTSSHQKKVISTVDKLPDDAADIQAPAVIVVGRVAALSETLCWMEKLPLFGKRFLITRPRRRAGELSEQLRVLGAEVIEFPTIDLQPIWDADLSELAERQWLALTSPSGVEIFMELMKRQRKDVRDLAGIRIAALGAGTAAALEKFGILADLTPPTYSARSLGIALASKLQPGDRVLVARAREGSPELMAQLQAVPWADVLDMPIYETVFTASPILKPLELIDEHTWAVFTSASTVRGFAAAAGTEELSAVRALCIGQQTANQAERYGMTTYVANAATMDGLVKLALECTKEEL